MHACIHTHTHTHTHTQKYICMHVCVSTHKLMSQTKQFQETKCVSGFKGSVQWKNDLGLYCSLVLVMNIGMHDLVILCLVYPLLEF